MRIIEQGRSESFDSFKKRIVNIIGYRHLHVDAHAVLALQDGLNKTVASTLLLFNVQEQATLVKQTVQMVDMPILLCLVNNGKSLIGLPFLGQHKDKLFHDLWNERLVGAGIFGLIKVGEGFIILAVCYKRHSIHGSYRTVVRHLCKITFVKLGCLTKPVGR